MEGSGQEGRGGKKWTKRESFIGVGVEASGRVGKRGGDLPMAIFLTGQMEGGVADDRRDFQCDDLAAFMALKLPVLESGAASWSGVRQEARARLEAEWNSRRETVASGDYHGLDR